MTGVVPRVRADARGDYLAAVLETRFTPEQIEIATHPLSPQLVVAGAGAGKTTVMAARVVHAIAVQGVTPGQVLGLTFTNKAAAELSTKVRRALGRLRDSGLLPPSDGSDADPFDDLPTVATYHAYAATIVRDHALRIGREPVTTLLSEAARWQLATRVVRQAEGPFGHLDWTTPAVVDKMLALAGEMAEHLVDPDAVRRIDARVVEAAAAVPKPVKESREAVAAARTREELLTLAERYVQAKERLDLIDFGDQVALAARIAQTAPVVGERERDRFRLVVLDEYQDTGVAQRLLLTALFGGHAVVAVGDPNQSIYGWRGASIGNLLRFPAHFAGSDRRPDASVQSLMTSFRCGGRILAAANVIAAAIGTGLPWRPPLAVEPLRPAPGRETAGEVVLARTSTDADEADWVAGRLAGEVASGRRPGQLAVLCRRSADFPRLHRALVGHGLPVEVVGLGGLLAMPEVADVVALLRVLQDPSANAAAVRILTGPRWRIGLRDLAALGARAGRLARWAPSSDREPEPAVGRDLPAALASVTATVDPVDVASLLDAVESPGLPDAYSEPARERLARLRAELTSLRRLTGQPLVELVTEVVRAIGLDVEIEAETEPVAAARAANLAAFVDQAASFTGLEGESDLPAFLAYLEAAETAEDGFDVGTVSDSDSVKLLTVHKAKGLEWEVVAVPGMLADVFPSRRGRPAWTRSAHVVPGELRGDASDLPRLRGWTKADLSAYTDDCRAEAGDEERRLAYVAFTRARDRLLLSTFCWSATRKNACTASPYLDELRAADADAVTIDTWCPDPGPEIPHPGLGAGSGDVSWPQPPDQAALSRRRAAADAVREALTRAGDIPETVQQVLGMGAALTWEEQADLVLDELRRERSAERLVPMPRQLTASQVVMLAHDPQELARTLARPVPVRPAAQARRGSRFHAWVESLWQQSPLLDTGELPGATDAELGEDELAALQATFLEGGWGELRPVAVEKPFELVVGGQVLRGRIDAVYGLGPDGVISAAGETAGGYDVIDYKTGAVPADFAAASLQLSIYRLAWADIAGVAPERVRAGFLYARTGQVKRPDRLLDRAQLQALLSR